MSSKSLSRVHKAVDFFRLNVKAVWEAPDSDYSLAMSFLYKRVFVIRMADTSYRNQYHEVGHVFLWTHLGKSISKKEFFEVFPKTSLVEFCLGKKKGGPGFISDYARSNHHEDFAETFAAACLAVFEGRKYKFKDKEVQRKFDAVICWMERVS